MSRPRVRWSVCCTLAAAAAAAACGGGARPGSASPGPGGHDLARAPHEVVVLARPSSGVPPAADPGRAAAALPPPPEPGLAVLTRSPFDDGDRDGDGIPDCGDLCPTEPEVWNGIDDEDGCPDASRLVVERSRIELGVARSGPVPGFDVPDSDRDAVLDGVDADGVGLASEPSPAEGPRRQQGHHPARLTAAVVADADDRAGFLAYLERHGPEAAELGLDLSRRVRLRVVDSTGRPVHDARLTLVGGAFRAEGRTHADGTWDFLPGLCPAGAAGTTIAYVEPRSGAVLQATLELPPTGDGHDVLLVLPGFEAAPPRALDLVFLIDVTGSMGDELEYVTEEVTGIVRRVVAAAPGVDVRLGATLYRDRGDSRPLEQVPLTRDLAAFAASMARVRAEGGGDYPEDMDAGLAAALTTQDWSEGPAARVLVLIADAPPQRYGDAQYTYRHAIADASRRGIRILPVAASGADRVVELLFRAMGLATSTPYVYLTDDSGLGLPHLEADSGPVTVEGFADCLTRLLVSDLRGLGMHAPVRAPART